MFPNPDIDYFRTLPIWRPDRVSDVYLKGDISHGTARFMMRILGVDPRLLYSRPEQLLGIKDVAVHVMGTSLTHAFGESITIDARVGMVDIIYYNPDHVTGLIPPPGHPRHETYVGEL